MTVMLMGEAIEDNAPSPEESVSQEAQNPSGGQGFRANVGSPCQPYNLYSACWERT